MPTLKIAHLREQGQDMIIVPLDASFGRKPQSDQQDTIGEIQAHAREAELLPHQIDVFESYGFHRFDFHKHG